jgi:hypothetical protein
MSAIGADGCRRRRLVYWDWTSWIARVMSRRWICAQYASGGESAPAALVAFYGPLHGDRRRLGARQTWQAAERSVASLMTASRTGVMPNVPFVVAVGASVPVSR